MSSNYNPGGCGSIQATMKDKEYNLIDIWLWHIKNANKKSITLARIKRDRPIMRTNYYKTSKSFNISAVEDKI